MAIREKKASRDTLSAGSGSMFSGSGNRKNLYHPFQLLRCDSVLYTRCIKRTWWKCKEEVHLDSFCEVTKLIGRTIVPHKFIDNFSTISLNGC